MPVIVTVRLASGSRPAIRQVTATASVRQSGSSTAVMLSPAGIGSRSSSNADCWGPALPTVRVKVTVPPGATGSGPAVLVRLTSAAEVMSTDVVAVLSLGSDSSTGAVTAAVLVRAPSGASGATIPVRVTVRVASTGTEAQLQLTWSVTVQLAPPASVTVTASRPSGIESVSSTFGASEGPPLETDSWYWIVCPGMAVAGEAVLIRARLAPRLGSKVATPVLFSRSGSGVTAVTDAAFCSAGVDPVGRVTGTVTVTLSPTSRAGTVQATIPPGAVHVPSVVVTVPTVTPGSSGSAMASPVARDGPLLVTVSW